MQKPKHSLFYRAQMTPQNGLITNKSTTSSQFASFLIGSVKHTCTEVSLVDGCKTQGYPNRLPAPSFEGNKGYGEELLVAASPGKTKQSEPHYCVPSDMQRFLQPILLPEALELTMSGRNTRGKTGTTHQKCALNSLFYHSSFSSRKI